MQLELKHIAPYLPYRVEILQPNAEGRKTFTLDVEGLRIMEVEGFENFKLILHRLSNLKGNLNFFRSESVLNHVINYPCDIDELQYITLKEFNYLLNNHFDVFGLIDKGLAVAIE